MTLRETFIDRFTYAGFVLADSKSKKYIKFRHPTIEYYVLIGKCGSLRWSRSGNIARSYPYNDTTRERILKDAEWAKAFLAVVPLHLGCR